MGRPVTTGIADVPLKPFNVPLTGKLRTFIDGTQHAEGDFQVLQNYRYIETGIKGVQGMTKVNTNALTTQTKILCGIHFKKDKPSESHVLVQAIKTDNTASKVFINETAIGSQGDFEATAVWTDSSGAGRGYFSEAPDGNIVYCNGIDSCIWGGNESRVGSFINFDPLGTFKYNYTDRINNTLTTTVDTAYLKRASAAIDSATMLLLHMDGTDSSTTFTDSSPTTPHTVTAVGNAQLKTAVKKFGTASGYFDGTGDWLTVPDNADFDFSGGTFTIDTWVNCTNFSSDRGIAGQGTDSKRYWKFYISTTGAVTLKIFTSPDTAWATGAAKSLGDAVIPTAPNGYFYECTVAGNTHAMTEPTWPTTVGATVVDNTVTWTCRKVVDTTIATGASAVTAATWTHLTLVGTGAAYYIFVDGVQQGYSATTNIICDMLTNVLYIGADNAGTSPYLGYLDEFRISNSSRWTSNFSVPTVAYGANPITWIHLGALRPISGVKLYVKDANTTSTTAVSVSYWSGTGWASVSSLTDGTVSGGKTLAQTGSLSWSTTVGSAKPKLIYKNYAYWYLISFENIDNNTSLSYVTVNAPFQPIVDLWDGEDRRILSYYKYTNSTGTYTDDTYLVVSEDGTDYSGAGSMTSSDALYCGFYERLTGITFSFVGSYINTTANTIATVYYWNGSAWTSVGTIDDGTKGTSQSFNKTGTITWNAPAEELEFTNNVSDDKLFYYYKIQFSQTLSSDVRIDYVAGIPAPTTITGYKFPIYFQNKIWLCSESTGDKNMMLGSVPFTSSSFNGANASQLVFGNDQELTAAGSLFSRFGGDIYENLVVCKANETWFVNKGVSGDYQIFKVSDTTGCITHGTMKSCNTSYDVTNSVQKHIVIWRSSSGIQSFDGNALSPISADIQDFFEYNNANETTAAMRVKECGFYDERENEYHWLFDTGGNTTLTKEFVFNLTFKKWFEIVRTGKLQCGFPVIDSNYGKYIYGALTTGYLERLEYGQTFDGTGIAYRFKTVDMPFFGWTIETLIRKVKLIFKAKNTTAATITITHYGDTSTTGTAATAISCGDSTKRVIQAIRSVSWGNYTFHSFDVTITTTNETIGCEPIGMAVLVKQIRQDIS